MLYGATIAGQAGVARVIEILQAEIQRNLALLGIADIRNLGEDSLVPSPQRC